MPPDSALKAEETKIEEWLRKSIPLQGHKLFLGMWEEKGMGCYFKMLFLHCFGGKFEDRRDWQAIDAWADGIVNELRVDQQVSGPLGN
jgi:menaquinone-dependent protoporphyrinogen oxidase